MSASSSLEDLQHHDVEEEVVEPTLATEEWTGGSSPLPEDTLPPLEESTTLSPSNLPLLSSQTLHVSMTLPHGFQLQRTLMHPKSTVRLVVFTPHHHLSDAFASLDTHAVHFWRGAQRVQRIPIAGVELTKEDLVSIQDGGNGFGGLMGISLWVYVRKHRLFLVATDHLELKVLDQNLVELSRSSSVKPVLSLEYIDSLEEVIVGCIGSIRICSLVREAEHTNRTIFYLKPPRLVLNDFEDDEWANKTLFLPSTVKLYVACDNRIYIYDYESGKRLDTLPNLHELSITCIAFYEPTEWLITAGKEGQIRIWNIQHYLVASINAHSQTITSLLLPLNFSNLDKPPPILLSSSLDGSLRLWDLEKLQCIYKHATQHEVLGLGMLKKDFFFHYSRKSIYIWHLNRLLSTYYYTQSRVVSLKRVCHHQLARILVVTEDGCIRLLSPVSGEVLVTCFPTYKQIHIIDILHDLAEGPFFFFFFKLKLD
ncbi:WD repeat-containing protein 87 [Coelomomyces lativittatus]|nr:WD repeat-containing protein 87 [Coelomomyces lativittatus]